MAAFNHRNVASEKPFAHASKHAQEIAAARPDAFHRVGVNFSNPVTIIIAGPLTVSRCMTDGLMDTAGGTKVMVGRPLIGGDDCVGARMGHQHWFQRGAIRVFAEAQPDVPTAAPHDSDNRWARGGPGSMATRLVRAPTRRVLRIGVLAPFLASVLIQFIGFGHRIGQR